MLLTPPCQPRVLSDVFGLLFCHGLQSCCFARPATVYGCEAPPYTEPQLGGLLRAQCMTQSHMLTSDLWPHAVPSNIMMQLQFRRFQICGHSACMCGNSSSWPLFLIMPRCKQCSSNDDLTHPPVLPHCEECSGGGAANPSLTHAYCPYPDSVVLTRMVLSLDADATR